jgi:hypothetical protein
MSYNETQATMKTCVKANTFKTKEQYTSPCSETHSFVSLLKQMKVLHPLEQSALGTIANIMVEQETQPGMFPYLPNVLTMQPTSPTKDSSI